MTVIGAFILFGGWYVLSANSWFKGRIRQGSEAEFERIEGTFGGRGRHGLRAARVARHCESREPGSQTEPGSGRCASHKDGMETGR